MPIELSPFGHIVLEDRYALKDETGKLIEKDIFETFRRVAKSIASKEKDPDFWEEKFYKAMSEKYFCPAGRVLAHSGTSYSQLFNCFVLPFEEDSLESIMDTAKKMAVIFKYGGGVGFNYSSLRPSGSYIKGVNGHSCGTIGFIHMMSSISEVIEQGGTRRSASLGLLEVWHPDIWDFISYKSDHNWERLLEYVDVKDREKWLSFKHENLYKWQMYNVSVGVNDEFFDSLEKDDVWPLYWDGQEWELYKVRFNKFVRDGEYKSVDLEVTAYDESTALWKVKGKIPFPTVKDNFEIVGKRKIKAKELWDKICVNAWLDGCPGLINLSTARKMHNLEYANPILSTNPCLHGDTLVAVADGRNAVTIRKLAEEDKDVPVYCRNNKGKVTIRMMRNPRITGYNEKLLKITIDNGHQLKVTEGHKFVLSDGSVVEAKDLKAGDSLSIMSKLKASFEKVLRHSNSKSQDYYWVNSTDKKAWVLDHRLIYNFHFPKKLGFKDVIHHKDRDGLNNVIGNLERVLKEKHDRLHAKDMLGDKNPMRRAKTEWSDEKWRQYKENMSEAVSGELNGRYGGVSNKDLFNVAVGLTKELGRKLSSTEWQKYALERNYPSQFSKFREDAFGTVAQFLEMVAVEAGVQGIGLTNADLREYNKFLRIVEESDLNVFFDGHIKVNKVCEKCGKIFAILYAQREQCFCSQKCNLLNVRDNGNNLKAVKARHVEIRKKKRIQQINAFNELKSELGRVPFKRELVAYCKKKGIPFRLPTKREISEKGHIGTFKGGYTELKEAALSFNHRVVSVEPCGLGVVYNGTVDEFHNFYVGHFRENQDGCCKFVYINNLQCGEQALSGHSSCNLSSIILPTFIDKGELDKEQLKEVVSIAIRFGDNVIDNCEFPIPEIEKKAKEERRVGLGLMGVHDALIAMRLNYDSQEGRDFIELVLTLIRDTAYLASIELAKEKGAFPLFDKEKFLESGFIKTLPDKIRKSIQDNGIRNSTLLTQAPTGSISALLSVSSGCEPWFALKFQRNTKLGSYEDGCPSYLEWVKNNPDKEKPSYFKTSQEIDPIDHVKMLLVFSKYVCSSVSKTVNLPNSADVKEISEIFQYAMKSGAKGITVFRDGCKDGVLINKDNKKIAKEAEKVVHDLQNLRNEETFEIGQFRKRGNRTEGSTYRVHMQNHNLYITVNRNKDGELVEVFATVGESKNVNTSHTSGVEDSWAEGLGKIISLALRAGVDIKSIIRNLKNIPSDKPVFVTIGDCDSSELIPSPPHAIARIIEEESNKKVSVAPERDNKDLSMNKICRECGSQNTKSKGPTCYTCIDCGNESCG